MAWYRAGSVTVTNGSPVVTGAGTAFVANVQAGHAINLPDGRVYEVASVDSNSQLTLGSVYLGGTAGGQGYSVQPNQGFAQSAASRLSDFLSQVSGWVAGALAGRFGDGNPSIPGISFAADQDTGMRRFGENGLSIVTGGIDRIAFDGSGRIGIGTQSPNSTAKVHINSADASATYVLVGNANNGVALGVQASGAAAIYGYSGIGLIFGTNLATSTNEFARFDSSGNFLIGVGSGTCHTIKKGANQSDPQLTIFGAAQFFVASGSPPDLASAMTVSFNTITNRSISAGGTINASGADFAEYLTKAKGCGDIAKGDPCGVDANGELTTIWTRAVSFVVKSTNPGYVGGDNWAQNLPSRPVDPGKSPIEPAPPNIDPEAPEQDQAAAKAAYKSALEIFAKAMIEHEATVARYALDWPAWQTALEAARARVDRIAFAGQVPVNVSGPVRVGDYLVAAAGKAGEIVAIAVAASDITFDQYRRRLGKVWAIRDGRPWIDVQHG